MPTKATKTIKQVLVYKPQHAAWFEGTQALFNQVVAFYFEVIQAHPGMPLSVAIPADRSSDLPECGLCITMARCGSLMFASIVSSA